MVRNSIITKGGGSGGLVQPGMKGVTVTNCPDVDPGFANWQAGDFRNKSGYGPTYLQL